MLALTVQPGREHSAKLRHVPEPPEVSGTVVVESLAIGICGTDREILDGHYGAAPPDDDFLILGHESCGRVVDAPPESGLSAGDLVVGIVRRPDPVPCPNCAVGEWDMCRNGRFRERGIKELHGYCSERFRIEPEFTVKIDSSLERAGVLVEPASVVAKAWEHTERIGQRAFWEPQSVLVTGAGPVGLLAALLGVQRRLDVRVFDRITEGPKPELVRRLGATYHTDSLEDLCQSSDIILECTGAASVVLDAIQYSVRGGIVCLTGISSGGRSIEVNMTAVNRSMVLENNVVFGSVNANRSHYRAAANALAQADREWLSDLITRRVALADWKHAMDHGPDTVKNVIEPNK